MRALKQILPREHGTWAMLLTPFAVGAGVAGRFGARESLLLGVVVLAFLAQAHLAHWLRARAAPRPDAPALRRARRLTLGLGAAAAAGTAGLVLGWGLTGLLALAAAGVAVEVVTVGLVERRVERALPGQVLAPLGLALTAPAAHYVATGVFDRRAVALWALNALFFLGGVLYVRLKIAAIPRRAALAAPGARLRFAAPTLALDVALVGLAGAAAWLGDLSPWVLLGFASVAGQAVVGTLRLDRPAVLKRVGLISTAHSALFAVLVIALA